MENWIFSDEGGKLGTDAFRRAAPTLTLTGIPPDSRDFGYGWRRRVKEQESKGLNCLGRCHHKNSEAQDIEPGSRVAATAVPGPAMPKIVVPRTAAHHAKATSLWPLRVSDRPHRVIFELVLAPLPDVAVHVIWAEGVRGLLAFGVGLTSPVILVTLIPGDARQVGLFIARVVRSSSPRAAGIFPFSLSRQA